jgi:hypothetical protein
LVIDINGLLCDAKHVKFAKGWNPLESTYWCENKLVSLGLDMFDFLHLCSQIFDIMIWSQTTLPNLVPIIQYLLKVEGLKPIFVWDEVSPRLRNLGPQNALLINDCPFKCIGNMSYSSNILPLPF